MKDRILNLKQKNNISADKNVENDKPHNSKKGIIHRFGMIAVILAPLYLYFCMEYFYFESIMKIAKYSVMFPGARVFSLLIIYGVFFALWFIVKNGFAASLILYICGFLLAVANYFKHSLTGDFVYPWDIVNQKGNIGELVSFLKVGLPFTYILLILLAVVLLIIIYKRQPEIKLSFIPRFIAFALMISLVSMPFINTNNISKTVSAFNMLIESTANQDNNHVEHGFTGGFLVNVMSMAVNEPENYTENNVNEIIQQYTAKQAKNNFSSPDVIVILAESFWDPKLLPRTEFSENPIKNFEEISSRDNAISGNMFETATGGGTVRTEFEVLTGLSVEQLPVGSVPWQYVKENVTAYPSYFKSLGYRTVAMHTYNSSFYLRKSTYPKLGFDELYFSDELTGIEDIDYSVKGNYISDDSFVDYLEYIVDMDSSKPCFFFGITMENHQPYENKFAEYEVDVKNPAFTDDVLNSVLNYTTGVRDSDLALKKLVDYIDNREKDTLLVWFGDHQPTLGANRGAYVQSGYIVDGNNMTAEEKLKIYSAPYLIYGNFDLAESDMIESDKKMDLSAYNLLNAAVECAGAPKTPYMEFLKDFYLDTPYYNDRIPVVETERLDWFVSSHRLLTHDILLGNNYSGTK